MSDLVLVKKFQQIVESIELTKLTEYLFRYLFDLQERRILTLDNIVCSLFYRVRILANWSFCAS